jgi:hypothetical protein
MTTKSASKEEHAASRQVTNDDLALVDKAINDHETFQRGLYVVRRILAEVGRLDERLRGLREAISAVEREGALTNSHLEQTRADLAKFQAQEVEKREVVAALDREIKQKEQMIDGYARQIERITGAAA